MLACHVRGRSDSDWLRCGANECCQLAHRNCVAAITGAPPRRQLQGWACVHVYTSGHSIGSGSRACSFGYAASRMFNHWFCAAHSALTMVTEVSTNRALAHFCGVSSHRAGCVLQSGRPRPTAADFPARPRTNGTRHDRDTCTVKHKTRAATATATVIATTTATATTATAAATTDPASAPSNSGAECKWQSSRAGPFNSYHRGSGGSLRRPPSGSTAAQVHAAYSDRAAADREDPRPKRLPSAPLPAPVPAHRRVPLKLSVPPTAQAAPAESKKECTDVKQLQPKLGTQPPGCGIAVAIEAQRARTSERVALQTALVSDSLLQVFEC